ncbi:MAG: FAD-dependent oxidoreductase [Pseudomonadota bacterium]
MKIAVIGGGIAGLSAAWLLCRRHDVSLYEGAGRLGGHANTVDVALHGETVPVDAGFIVYNEHNYPHLTRLFDALDVATVASNMSFAISLNGGRFEYAGSSRGLFAQPSNVLRPTFWQLVRDLLRFYRSAPSFAARHDLDAMTLGDLLRQGGYSDLLARRHILPMAAAIWSSKLTDILDFPARTFVQFFENHGLFSLGERPQWRSVLGGSRNYVDALAAPFRDNVHLATPVTALRRTPAGVFVRDNTGHEQRFDEVVVAAHANQALAMLGDGASDAERRILGAFRYQENDAVMHSDTALMPRRRRAWSSWNYMSDGCLDDLDQVSVSYWMNRLQRLPTNHDVFVTLNPERQPSRDLTHAAFTYHHPQFDKAALDAQHELPTIQGYDRIWFCGSYCGYGFHEDGLQAGIAVAEAFGVTPPWANDVTPMSPAWRAVMPATPAMAAE